MCRSANPVKEARPSLGAEMSICPDAHIWSTRYVCIEARQGDG